MYTEDVKFSRLVKISKMYYEDDLSQNEIAKIFKVSRPMVSKLLKEAKELGIVNISINDVKNIREALGEKIALIFNLKACIVVPNYEKENASTIFEETIFKTLFTKTNIKQRIGIGFGSSIGNFANYCESKDCKKLKLNGEIMPIIGDLHASFNSYNTNKLTTSIAKKTNLDILSLNIPALLNSNEEKLIYKESAHFKTINASWDNLDNILINVSNIFTTPDLASSIRFDNSIIKKNAVGRFLAYPFDINGNFISETRDIVMQIDIEQLRKSRDSIAILTKKLDTKAAIGALNTKVFTKCILNEDLAQKIINHFI